MSPKSDITWSDVNEGLKVLWRHYWYLKDIDAKQANSFSSIIVEATKKIKRS